jgi:glycine cleavage system protein P-like pyridoxal-binding family
MASFSETLANFNKKTGRTGGSGFTVLENEDGESLLGSFRQRASESISSFMVTNPDKECLGLSTFQVYRFNSRDILDFWQ